MADWADQEANELAGICGVQGDAWRIAEALRQARLDALEEAARIASTRGVYPELNVHNGGPEWYRHGQEIAAIIRDLKVKQP